MHTENHELFYGQFLIIFYDLRILHLYHDLLKELYILDLPNYKILMNMRLGATLTHEKILLIFICSTLVECYTISVFSFLIFKLRKDSFIMMAKIFYGYRIL